MELVLKWSREMVGHVESREAFKWMLSGFACSEKEPKEREEHMTSK